MSPVSTVFNTVVTVSIVLKSAVRMIASTVRKIKHLYETNSVSDTSLKKVLLLFRLVAPNKGVRKQHIYYSF